MPSLLLKFGPWVACVVLGFWLYAEKQAHKASLAQAETDKALSIAAAERTTRQTLSEAHRREIAQKDQLIAQAENVRLRLAEDVQVLESQVAGQAGRITQLEFEADIDEIPTYADCSIVYIPSRVLHAGDCGQAGAGGGFDYRVCVGAEGLNEANSTFTNITIGDAHKLWGADRAALGRCNAQLAAIESLEVPDE